MTRADVGPVASPCETTCHRGGAVKAISDRHRRVASTGFLFSPMSLVQRRGDVNCRSRGKGANVAGTVNSSISTAVAAMTRSVPSAPPRGCWDSAFVPVLWSSVRLSNYVAGRSRRRCTVSAWTPKSTRLHNNCCVNTGAALLCPWSLHKGCVMRPDETVSVGVVPRGGEVVSPLRRNRSRQCGNS